MCGRKDLYGVSKEGNEIDSSSGYGGSISDGKGGNVLCAEEDKIVSGWLL